MNRQQILIVVAMVGCAVMIGMDFTGAATIVTSIEDDYGTDLTTSQWILTLYALTFGMGIVTGGKLGDIFGHRRVLLIGLAVFMLSSALIALAPDVWLAIGFRALQGIGGAMIWPQIVAISFNSVPPAMSSVAVGFALGGAGFGNVLGPIIAGLSAEFLIWQVLFWVNVPIALGAAGLVLAYVPRDDAHQAREPLDVRGILVLTLALFGAMFALDISATEGWTSPAVIGLFVGAAVLAVAFVLIEPRVRDPLVPPELMRDRPFVAALLANGLLTPAWFSAFLYIPQYLVKVLDYSAFEGAIGLLPAMALFAALSPISGRFYAALGPHRLIGWGYVATTLAAINFAVAQSEWGYLGIVPGLVFLGIGGGVTIASAGTAAVAAVDAEHTGVAGGLSFMVHLVFGAIGVAIGTALFTTVASQTAVGQEFLDGMGLVFAFAAAASAAGVATAFFLRSQGGRLRTA